jgi:hypothetical protein
MMNLMDRMTDVMVKNSILVYTLESVLESLKASDGFESTISFIESNLAMVKEDSNE